MTSGRCAGGNKMGDWRLLPGNSALSNDEDFAGAVRAINGNTLSIEAHQSHEHGLKNAPSAHDAPNSTNMNGSQRQPEIHNGRIDTGRIDG